MDPIYHMTYVQAVVIGLIQGLAELFPISSLGHTVLIRSWLTGSLGAGVRGQILAGSVAAAATSLFAVLFLARYFRTRTLAPFAVYCLLAGPASAIRFGFFGWRRGP